VGVLSRRRAAPAVDTLPAGQEKARRVREMFDGIARRYDVLNRVLTFGMDVGWRRRTVRSLRLTPGSLVLDVACGTGDLCRELVASGYRPVGFDFSFGMLRASKARTPMVQADALALPIGNGVADGVTCGFALRNVVDLERLFAEMARVLRKGGRAALLEVASPSNAVLRAGHAVYFNRMVPLVGGLLSDRAAYRYLPRSVAYLPPPSDLLAMLRRAGFADVRRVALAGGIAQLVTGTRA
jgi:demethylmenaquinone methyltransferase / 2-methoxy-6-polyprenyl-1,4-benzoquinol methylase